MKRCSKCGLSKSFDEFYTDSNPRNKTGRQSRCISCAKENVKLQRQEHPDIVNKWNREWRKANPDKVKIIQDKKIAKRKDHYKILAKERSRRYRERNPSMAIKGNAERLRRWRKRHPEVEKAIQTARRSIFKRIPVWGDKQKIFEVYSKSKQYGFEVDHIVPIKHKLVCGLHVWHNLQLLDRNLNRSKCNKHWPDMPTE